MVEPCVGFLEFATIAKGIETTDALLKKAVVEIAFSYPVSSGKYLTMFHGAVEAVKSSYQTGLEIGGSSVIDSFVIANLHQDVFNVYHSPKTVHKLNALGILETTTCASCIEAADIAVKTAQVDLIKIQLARGIGGKAYFIVDGEVSDVESSLLAASSFAGGKGALLERIVIPQATPDLLVIFTQ